MTYEKPTNSYKEQNYIVISPTSFNADRLFDALKDRYTIDTIMTEDGKLVIIREKVGGNN